MPGYDRAHYKGTYARRAKTVRDAANADEATCCWRCGQTSDAKRRHRDPWQAGHLIDGDPTSPLAAEHRSCNASAGARSKREHFKTSRKW